MTNEKFYKLGLGDVIKFKGRGKSYLVIHNDGKKIKAVSVIEDSNPKNWEIVAKATYSEENINEKLLGGL